MRVACWVSKTTRSHARTHTHRNIKHSLLFHGNNGFANVPERYILRTLPVLSVNDRKAPNNSRYTDRIAGQWKVGVFYVVILTVGPGWKRSQLEFLAQIISHSTFASGDPSLLGVSWCRLESTYRNLEETHSGVARFLFWHPGQETTTVSPNRNDQL